MLVNIQQIMYNKNFSEPSLGQLKTYASYEKFKLKHAIAIEVAFIIFIFILVGIESEFELVAFLTSVIIFSIPIIVVTKFIFFMYSRAYRKTDVYRQFAINNDIVFLKNGKLENSNPNVDINANLSSHLPLASSGAVFKDSRPVAMKYILGTNNFAVYDYEYTTGSDKNRRTYYWHVGAWRLSRPLPHILFDSKKNNFWRYSNLPNVFDRSQIISLESTLDEHFDFYSPEGYGIDTLSYLTPEILEILVNHYSDYEIEVIDNYLFIYAAGPMKVEKFWDFQAKLQTLATELEDNIDSYRDRRVTTALSSELRRNQIAQPGLRLKKSTLPVILGAVGFAIFGSLRLWLESGNVIMVYVVVVIALAYIAYILAKNNFKD